jgi:hypothetical protein
VTYSFQILPVTLHESANATIEWFIQNWGVNRRNIAVEQPFHQGVDFRPTFVARMSEGNILCIEVSESIYSNTLDSVVLDCRDKVLPVKLIVAVPRDTVDPDYGKKLRNAKSRGVGIFHQESGDMIQQPLLLSLAGLRPINTSQFPTKYRQSLQSAYQTFRDGNPNKACADVYDQLEGLCRRFAKKCVRKGYWQNTRNLDLDNGSWTAIIRDIERSLRRPDPEIRRVTTTLLSRVVGVTPHRNDSGHLPRNLNQTVRRDQALRTRFESAVDLLKDFIDATSSLHI